MSVCLISIALLTYGKWEFVRMRLRILVSKSYMGIYRPDKSKISGGVISPGRTHQKSSKWEKNCDTHIAWQAVCVEDVGRLLTDVTLLSLFNTFAKEALCLIRLLNSTLFLSLCSINICVFPNGFRSCRVFYTSFQAEYSPVIIPLT